MKCTTRHNIRSNISIIISNSIRCVVWVLNKLQNMYSDDGYQNTVHLLNRVNLQSHYINNNIYDFDRLRLHNKCTQHANQF